MIANRGALIATIVATSAAVVATAFGLSTFSYEAPPRCPGEQRFLEQVRVRSPVHASVDQWPSLSQVKVRITKADAGFVGVLHVRTTQRSVVGKTCEEVVSALALVLSLAPGDATETAPAVSEQTPPPHAKAIARKRSSVPTSAPKARPNNVDQIPPEETALPSSAPPLPPQPPPSTPPPLSPPASTPAEQPSDLRAVAPAAAATPVYPRRYSVGVGVQSVLAPGPRPLWGSAVQFVTVRPWRGALASGLRLQVQGALSPAFVQPQGGGSFRWAAARMELCPLFLQTSFVNVLGCAGGAMGLVNVQGEANGLIVKTANVTRPWVDASGSIKVSWRLGERWSVGAGGTILFPLSRDKFEVIVGSDAPVEVHRAPAVGGLVEIYFSRAISR